MIVLIISGLFYFDYHFQSKLGFTLLLGFVAVGSLFEFYGMYENIGVKTPKIIPSVVILWWLLLAFLNYPPKLYVLQLNSIIVFVFLLVMMIYYLFSIRSYQNIFVSVIGFVYVLVPIAGSLIIYNACGLWGLVYVIAIIKIGDSLAYFGGTWFGKHKLAPTISPNKTVEGFIIGILGGALSGFLLLYVMNGGGLALSFKRIILVFTANFIIVMFGQMGDLLESMFKRHCQIKDSGKWLGGLGGVLDTVDSLFLGIPVALFAMTELLKWWCIK